MMDITNSFINSTFSSPATESANDYDYDYYDYGTDGKSGWCEYEHHGSYFLPGLYTLFFILGLLGNVLVLLVMCLSKQAHDRRRSITYWCLLNLAIADLLLVCSLPFLAHQARDQWPFGNVMCKMVLGAYYIGFYCGIFFITLMSIERYLTRVHMFKYDTTGWFGITAAIIVWIVGFLASFPELSFLQVQESPNKMFFCAPLYTSTGGNGTTTHIRHYWGIFSLFKINILGLLVFSIMVFCYTRIIWGSSITITSVNRYYGLWLRHLVVTVAVFFCCWAPYNVASFFKALELLQVYSTCESSKTIKLALEVTKPIAYFHSCINPILVFQAQGGLRRLMNRILRLMNRINCRAEVQDTPLEVDEQEFQEKPNEVDEADPCREEVQNTSPEVDEQATCREETQNTSPEVDEQAICREEVQNTSPEVDEQATCREEVQNTSPEVDEQAICIEEVQNIS